jgi:DNA-binding beta-propeller fold protein YncE
MKAALVFLLSVVAVTTSLQALAEELPRDEESEPLVLVRIIPMPSAKGRIDHMAVDTASGRVFAAVYGSDTLDVVDVHRAREVAVLRTGLNEPQGIAFVPTSGRIVVSNSGDGSCAIFNGGNYQHLGSVSFSDDADQLRYDPSSQRIFVGYGDGAIGIIDTRTWKLIPDQFQLGAHPESFQLDEPGHRLFVNLASMSVVAVIHLDTRRIDQWKLTDAGTNFPMTLDVFNKRVFVAARRPARLLVLDMDSGKQIASLPGAADTDDMWYDRTRRRIYVPSGEGFIFVYQQIDSDHYERIAKIPTATGARTSAYFGQVGKHNSLYLAVPGRSGRGAELWVFETRD